MAPPSKQASLPTLSRSGWYCILLVWISLAQPHKYHLVCMCLCVCVCEVEESKPISDKPQQYQVLKLTQAVCEGMTGRGQRCVCVSMLACVKREAAYITAVNGWLYK